MERSKKSGRPRLLSDIPEIVPNDPFALTEKQGPGEGHKSPLVTQSSHQLQPTSIASWLGNIPTFDRPSNPHFFHISSAERLQIQPLAPTYQAVMAGSAPPSTSRADLPALQTSPPSPSSQSHDASPAAERSSSERYQAPSSPSGNRRGRARFRSPSRPPPVQAGTMNRKHHP